MSDRLPAPWPRRFRWLGGSLTLLAALAIARWEIIDSPPYYDFALGLFTEANYLVETDFDYYRLRYFEKVGNDGGPRVYMISIAPTLLALLMKLVASTRVVLTIGHLATFASATALILGTFALLRPYAGVWPAAAGVALMATTPLVSTQFDMLGIDLPMTAAAVISILLATRNRLLAANAAALLAFAIKPTGIIAAGGLLLHELGRVLAGGNSSPRRARWRFASAAALTLGILLLELLAYRWSGLNQRLRELATGTGYLAAVLSLCPDQFAIAVISALGTIVYVQRARRRKGESEPRETSLPSDSGLLLVAWAMLGATVAAIVAYAGVYSVRYLLLGIPFLFVIFTLTVLARLKARTLAAATAALVVFNLANWNGYFFPDVSVFPRHCSRLERSHEYLADHRSNIAAVRLLEECCQSDFIVAGFPFPYYLSYPRLGYVSTPLRGYSINPFWGDRFPSVARLFDGMPSRLVFIRVDNAPYALAMANVPPPDGLDAILFDDNLKSPLVVYRKDTSRMAAEPDREEWLLSKLWLATNGGAPAALTAIQRAQLLDEQGYPRQAIQVLVRSGGHREFEGKVLLGMLLAKTGQRKEALEQLQAAARERPGDANVHLQLGTAWLAFGDVGHAQEAFERALELNPQFAEPHHRLGVMAIQAGQFGRAIEQLRRCVQLAPEDPLPHNTLGIALAKRGDWQAARREFLQALSLKPDFDEARRNLLGLEDEWKKRSHPAAR
jgi:Flp pilus assembly protein TadD